MEWKSEKKLFNYIEAHAYAGVFSDIMDEMNLRNQVISPDLGIRPLTDHFVIIGRSCTLMNTFDEKKDDPYGVVIECIDNLEPGTVLVTTGNEPLEEGIMGELTATALKSKGARGAVVDGYSRDVRKIKKMDFPTFAKGGSPIDTTGRVKVIDYNVPITIGGVRVNPQDLIYADLDGILVIPRQVEQEVIEKALERIGLENTVRADLNEGQSMRSVWEKYHVL